MDSDKNSQAESKRYLNDVIFLCKVGNVIIDSNIIVIKSSSISNVLYSKQIFDGISNIFDVNV